MLINMHSAGRLPFYLVFGESTSRFRGKYAVFWVELFPMVSFPQFAGGIAYTGIVAEDAKGYRRLLPITLAQDNVTVTRRVSEDASLTLRITIVVLPCQPNNEQCVTMYSILTERPASLQENFKNWIVRRWTPSSWGEKYF